MAQRLIVGDQANVFNPDFRVFIGSNNTDPENEIAHDGTYSFPRGGSKTITVLYPKEYSLHPNQDNLLTDHYRNTPPYLWSSERGITVSAPEPYASEYNMVTVRIGAVQYWEQPEDVNFHVQLVLYEVEPIFGEGLTKIENEAYRGKGITGAITIADGVTTIGTGAFRDNQIESINLPDSLESIEGFAFDGSQLTSVVIPDSVTSIGERAFRNNQIASIDLPESLTTIGYETFRGNQLTSVDLPESLILIGEGAFRFNQLTSVVIPDSVTTIRHRAFGDNPLTEVSISSNTNYNLSSSFPSSAIITVRGETELPVEPEPVEPEPVEPEPEPETPTISFTYKEGKGFYQKFMTMTTQYVNGETVTVEGEYSTDVSITFTAENGYYLDNIVIDVDGKESSIFVGRQEISTTTLTAKNVKPNSVVTVWGYGYAMPTDTNIYSETLVNATSTMTGESTIDSGELTITFYANEGFVFDSVGTYTMNGKDYEFYASGKEYALTIEVDFDLSVELVATPLSVSDSISPFVNIYEVTRQELGELSLERFSTEYLDLHTGATSSGVDYGDMIVNLIRIPYDIPDYVERTREPIKLGKFVTTTMSNLLNTNHIKIKLGTVKVEGENGNVADYKNVRVFLYIPYADRMELPIEYVMDNEIEVTLELDLFSGNGVVTVTTQGVPVYQNMLTMSEKIPFVQLRDTEYSNKINALLYGTMKPFISLETQDVIEQVALPTQKDTVLNNLTGYVEVDRILSIDTKASVNEQAEILGLLRRGVEIK